MKTELRISIKSEDNSWLKLSNNQEFVIDSMYKEVVREWS